ncbi:RNA polymerase II subunit A C-terminal domain phosphatase-like [Anneissia japonica]|uniref:RNA polymerase II subunit A C-terminal domain phosphatase-like n=1 Tax=Anneissia japonica TaxID=1529436 RepID=UPI001425B3BD|nr:RNA polymerase II subunit A C-terminal domain phosphatase-like [Anneissia japonica]
MAASENIIRFCGSQQSKIVKLKVKIGARVSKGSTLGFYKVIDANSDDGYSKTTEKIRSEMVGTVKELLVLEGDTIEPSTPLFAVQGCLHPTVMKDMCAECGADLRKAQGQPGERSQCSSASVAMVHSIPELQVSKEEAVSLAKADEERLLKHHKLVLVVDLDQTLIHTTMDAVPATLKNVHHFQLWNSGPQSPWYHTRIRPGCQKFLEEISKYYELHIFTMGARLYAHTIASFLDPHQKYFSHRILSRDECFDRNLKTANLGSIFPCGDSMVCIIDDREDVWSNAPNLIHVKPYCYFSGTGDINTPPLYQKEAKVDDSFKQIASSSTVNKETGKGSPEESIDTTGQTSNTNGSKTSESLLESTETELENGNLDQVKKLEKSNCTSESKDKAEDMENKSKKPVDEKTSPDKGDEDAKEKVHGEDLVVKKVEEKDAKVDNEEGGNYDGDDYLLYLKENLIQVHQKFYEVYDHYKSKSLKEKTCPVPDLKAIVPSIRKSILAGVNIVFSGVFPIDMPPEKSRAWRVAKEFGANISVSLISRFKDKSGPANATTHLVAAKSGTEKVRQARRMKNVKIVSVDWLWCCQERWEHVDERLFLLHSTRKSGRSSNRSRSSTPASAFTDSDQDQELAKKAEAERLSDVPNKPPAGRLTRLNSDYNPLYSFSTEDLKCMDMEVDDIFNESSDESQSDNCSGDNSLGSVTVAPSSSSEDSLDPEEPHGWKRKRPQIESDEEERFKKVEKEDSSSSPGLSDEDRSEDEDKMAAAIDDLLTYSKVL